MSNDPFSEECGALLQHVKGIWAAADRLPGLSLEGRDAAVAGVLDFLDHYLTPRVVAEERTLFPLLAGAIHAPCDVETLARRHVAIRELTRRLHSADLADAPELQRLMRALASVIEAHLDAERDIVLPRLRAI